MTLRNDFCLERWTAQAAITIMVAVLITALAWLTHVIVCIKMGAWGFLIAGALVFPIAIIHGIGIWFGLW